MKKPCAWFVFFTKPHVYICN